MCDNRAVTNLGTPMSLREDARTIWDAAVAAVRPEDLVRNAVVATGTRLAEALAAARRIIVVGAGKAGAAMAAGVEFGLAERLDRVSGLVNVPEGVGRPLRAIRQHVARPAASNQPTDAGVVGSDDILKLVADAGPEDVVLCLLSGGGSALLPAPAEGITLADKRAVTEQLHACGATIGEMNAVRKHLSRIKGGGLAQASRAGRLFSLIVSDVVGDPLDVISSGPTAADPTTFAEALDVLRRYDLLDRVPQAVRQRLLRGASGELPETLKTLPRSVHNVVLGNNAGALRAAAARAESLGYRVLNLGSFVEGETRHVATTIVGLARSIATDGVPLGPPCCLLVGGETTVTLPPTHGVGGRNTEFVLAALIELAKSRIGTVVVLSGGTDGEDGPTDAAGALADLTTLRAAAAAGLNAAAALERHDSNTFFAATGDLLRTGLTETNVMDVRVVLIGRPIANAPSSC
jgi:hydroxypyruvate reductase/glycerate 2-kinase